MKQVFSIRDVLAMTTAAVLSTLSAKAQFKPGTLFVGTTLGTLGYSSANSDYGYDVGTAKSTGTKTVTSTVR